MCNTSPCPPSHPSACTNTNANFGVGCVHELSRLASNFETFLYNKVRVRGCCCCCCEVVVVVVLLLLWGCCCRSVAAVAVATVWVISFSAFSAFSQRTSADTAPRQHGQLLPMPYLPTTLRYKVACIPILLQTHSPRPLSSPSNLFAFLMPFASKQQTVSLWPRPAIAMLPATILVSDMLSLAEHQRIYE